MSETSKIHTPEGRWSHVAAHNLECRHLVILSATEPGYCEVVGSIIRPARARQLAEAMNAHAALTERVAALEATSRALVEKMESQPGEIKARYRDEYLAICKALGGAS